MPSFPRSELAAALSEQAFGITSAEITSSTDLVASARVVLAEGMPVTVSLTVRGYELGDVDENAATHGTVFESIEELLAFTSPLYVQAQQKALMAKLEALA